MIAVAKFDDVQKARKARKCSNAAANMSRVSVPKTYIVSNLRPSPRRRQTTTAPPDSALRLELRAGELVPWDGRVFRLDSLRWARARILEAGANELREVPVIELRGVSSLPPLQLEQRLESLRAVDRVVWNRAQLREAAIRDALVGDGSMTSRVEAATKSLGLSARTVRRLLTAFARPAWLRSAASRASSI
jgi:hypothetical protein